MALTKVIGQALGGILKAVGLVSTPGKAPTALPTATRDDATAAIAADDELQRRKGGAADILNGSGAPRLR